MSQRTKFWHSWSNGVLRRDPTDGVLRGPSTNGVLRGHPSQTLVDWFDPTCVNRFPAARRANARSARPVDLADHDRVTVARQEAQTSAAMSTAKTEEDFLRSVPNSENLISPNLMLFKLKLLGLPTSAVYGYGVSLVFVGLVGLLGLKRYSAPDQKQYCHSVENVS